ncbi:MAG: carbohydrate kinase [Denitrovibrio sp.]|nr:MAG: carbohydrate kinase [Denitrovibrio sp.]
MNDFNSNLLVFGEILYDVFEEEEKLGGAPFNVAYNLNMLGFSPLFISKVGDDKLGNKILSFMESSGLSTEYVSVDSTRPTGRVIVSVTAGEPYYKIIKDQAYDHIDGKLPEADGLIYYGTLAARSKTSKASLLKLIEKTTATKFYDVNLRKDCWDMNTVSLLASYADHMKLNENELIILTEGICPYDGGYVSRGRVLMEMYGIKNLYITFGAKGAAFISEDKNIESRCFYVESMKDTVGAGDAFSSVIISGLLNDTDIEKSLNMAAYYASRICTLQGALTEDKKFYEDIKEELNAFR